MGSQYPAEQPGNTSSILNTQDSVLDSRTDLLPTVPAPVAAVTNLDALTLDTHPGMPNVQQISPAISKKGKKEKKVREKGVSYFSLYRHADAFDILLMLLGTIGAMAAGAALPLLTLIFGKTLNTLGGSFGDVNPFLHQVNQIGLYFTYLALGTLFVSYAEVGFWMWTGTRQADRIRQKFLAQALVMDVSYFDLHASSGHLMQGLNEDCVNIQNAISEKVGNTLHHLATFAAGIAIAFSRGWAMTLVLLAVIPLIVVTVALLGKLQGKLQASASAAYADANSLVQEACGAIRTVFACTATERLVQGYSKALAKPEQAGIKGAFVGGLTVASLNGLFPMAWALALWYGSTRIEDGSYTGGQVLTVLLSAIIGGASLGQAGPNLQYFQVGCAAAKRVFDVIDRKPVIDERSPGGELPAVKGELQFKGVGFAYPSRPEVQVLSSLSFVVRAGETVAFVGESGSGKSTIIQLLQRFYDPLQGQVMLDGHDIRDLQLRWYRHQLGLVSQEPVLFSTTIANNISYGNPGVDQAGIEAAARAAHCYDFVMKLPLGFDTPVGERGVQLSGGQKQRVAIARAIARNPRVLLLDEATAALDTRSERAVQAALDGLMKDRTTIIVAHRLSTIVNATSIAVVKGGAIVEQGSHSHLLHHHPEGAYATLLKLQLMAQEADKADALGNAEALAADDAVPAHALQQLQKRDSQERPSSWRSGKASVDRQTSLKEVLTQPVADGKPATWRSRLPWLHSSQMEPKAKAASFWRLAQYNRPEWLWAVAGVIGSALQGAIMPAFAVALSSLIGAFYSTDLGYLKHQTTVWCLVLVAIGVVSFSGSGVQQWGFGVIGQCLTRRLRVLLFTAILRQEVAFFDKDENSSGSLSSELAVDTSHIRGAVGDQVGLITQNVVTFIAGYIIAFIASWKVTLVLTSILPLIVVASVVSNKFEMGENNKSHTMYGVANQTATEAFTSIRTVAAFSLGPRLSSQYNQAMVGSSRAGVAKANSAGASFGTSQFVVYATYGLIFWYGGQLIKDRELTLTDLLKVFFGIVFAAMGVANAQMAFPDVAKAKGAIIRVFGIIDRESAIDSASTEGLQPDKVMGRLELEDVGFAYPTRPEVPVFTGFSLTVQPGQTVALVGPSGSGKSTVIALIQRWYDPTAGRILMDGVDTRALNLTWMRSCIGLVGQEPVLFSGTIAENIAYGCNTPPSHEDIVEAARAANALSFIEQAPDGFNTRLGDGGGIALSGGQKQRVSIARALARNPRFLLLDEASSALDAASERLVQDALAKLQAGRTTLVIAHRLSTIRDASSIAVVQDGRILEQGTHQQLMRITGGSYASLVQHQRAA